jgi:hypothetical protein
MKKTIKVINELTKKGLIRDYAIGGGIAAIYYIEPMLTYDLDIFIVLPKEKIKKNLILLTPMFDYLKNKGYEWKGEHIIIEGVPVQFIPADKLEAEAVKNAKAIEYEGAKTRVITPEYLLSILLRAGRKKDIEKIDRFLEQAKVDKIKLKWILHRYGLIKKFALLTKGRKG